MKSMHLFQYRVLIRIFFAFSFSTLLHSSASGENAQETPSNQPGYTIFKAFTTSRTGAQIIVIKTARDNYYLAVKDKQGQIDEASFYTDPDFELYLVKELFWLNDSIFACTASARQWSAFAIFRLVRDHQGRFKIEEMAQGSQKNRAEMHGDHLRFDCNNGYAITTIQVKACAESHRSGKLPAQKDVIPEVE